MEYTIIFSSLLAAGALVFSVLDSPLAMGGALLGYSAGGAVLLGLVSPTFWFSYIMFLVFLGGVLILFIYIASLTPNTKHSLSYSSVVFSLPVVGIGLLVSVLDPSTFAVPVSAGSGAMEVGLSAVQELYSEGVVWGSGYMVVYLLFTLVVVVKMVTSSSGALRAMV